MLSLGNRRYCTHNWKQVRLPAARKANTQEAGADVKESGLFTCQPSGRQGLMSQSPYPHLSGGRGFHKEGYGNRTKRSREGFEKFSLCWPAQSIPIRQVMVRCASSHFTSSLEGPIYPAYPGWLLPTCPSATYLSQSFLKQSFSLGAKTFNNCAHSHQPLLCFNSMFILFLNNNNFKKIYPYLSAPPSSFREGSLESAKGLSALSQHGT